MKTDASISPPGRSQPADGSVIYAMLGALAGAALGKLGATYLLLLGVGWAVLLLVAVLSALGRSVSVAAR